MKICKISMIISLSHSIGQVSRPTRTIMLIGPCYDGKTNSRYILERICAFIVRSNGSLELPCNYCCKAGTKKKVHVQQKNIIRQRYLIEKENCYLGSGKVITRLHWKGCCMKQFKKIKLVFPQSILHIAICMFTALAQIARLKDGNHLMNCYV